GSVTSGQVIIDRFSGRSRGFGFVVMANDDEAEDAINALNGQPYGGRPPAGDGARPRGEQPPPGYGGGRRRGARGRGGAGGGGGGGGVGEVGTPIARPLPTRSHCPTVPPSPPPLLWGCSGELNILEVPRRSVQAWTPTGRGKAQDHPRLPIPAPPKSSTASG